MRLVRGVTFAALLSLCGASVPTAHSQDSVDAAMFLTAFRSGTADQFKGRTIAGTGLAFGMSMPVLITVGAAADDKQVTPVTTWDQLTAAQNARTTLQVMISVADFDPTSMSADRQRPNQYSFSGVYNGRMRTTQRPEAPNGLPDTGPCPPQPGDPSNLLTISSSARPMTSYCVPLLESGTLQKK